MAKLAKSEHEKASLRKCRMLVNLYFPGVRMEFDAWRNSHKATLDLLLSAISPGGATLGPGAYLDQSRR
jgi:hypothetical protein